MAVDDKFPPAGTKCQDCGCCPAAVFAGGVPVCWECDLGQTCRGKRAVPPALVMEKVERAAPRASTKGTPVSESLKAKILGADTAISHRQLALRLGTSDMTVRKVRLGAGIGTPSTTFNPRKAAAMPDQASLREKFDRDEPEPPSSVPAPAIAPIAESAAIPGTLLPSLGAMRDRAARAPSTAPQPASLETAESGAITGFDVDNGGPGVHMSPPRVHISPLTIGDHYAAVIADLEDKAVSLANDLEIITGALLPSLRTMRDRAARAPSTAPQPASLETDHV